MANHTWYISKNVSLPLNETAERCGSFESYSCNDKALMTTGYAILLTLSLTGNVLVIAVFYKRYNQLRTPVNYFVVNMSASDLLVPIFVIPRLITEVYLGFGPWLVGGVLGDILCRVVHLVDEVSMSVSSQSMVFVAAERFWAITFPLKRPLISRRTTPRCICFTWIFSLIFFSYYLVANKLLDRDTNPYCDSHLPQIFDTWEDFWRADRLSLLVTFVAIPIILLVIFYTAIIVKLHHQGRDTIHLPSRAQQRRKKENRRVTVMLVTVVAVFVISWTPYYVFFFHRFYSLGRNWSCESMKRLRMSMRFMNYVYTAVNPLIYYTFNAAYHQGFKDLLCCSWSSPLDSQHRLKRQILRRGKYNLNSCRHACQTTSVSYV